MAYDISLGLAWDELEKLIEASSISVSLLADDYVVRLGERAVLHKRTGACAEEMVAVLILHYLIGIEEHGYHPSGEWISFKETSGGKLFWPAFHETVIKPLAECFQRDPERLIWRLQERLGGRMAEGGDVAVEVETFPGIFVRLVFWKDDEELPAEATILFDRALNEIYCMEDVDVLLMVVAQRVIE
jgi:hypothetical protein